MKNTRYIFNVIYVTIATLIICAIDYAFDPTAVDYTKTLNMVLLVTILYEMSQTNEHLGQ